MSLHRRLRKLEGRSRVESGLRPCPSCGRVLHPPDEPTRPDQCPSCGRQLVFRVEHERAG